MKISISSDDPSRLVPTPAGLVPKVFEAKVKLNESDDYYLLLKIEIRTDDFGTQENIGPLVTSLSFVSESDSVFGITGKNLRTIAIRQILEACLYRAAIPGSAHKIFGTITNNKRGLARQQEAARIIDENPGSIPAEIVSKTLGIELQSARNLITRARKSNLLLPARKMRVKPLLHDIDESSRQGRILEALSEGEISIEEAQSAIFQSNAEKPPKERKAHEKRNR